MDIQALGARYLNDARFASPFAGKTGGTQSSFSAAGTGSGENPAFADILEKALGNGVPAASQTTAEEEAENGAFGSGETRVRSAPGSAQGDRAESAPASSRKPVIDKTGKLYEQCLALETFLTKTLISGMRSTVQKTGLIDDSFAGKMYEDMLYDEYAKTYTENANFGLADLAYLELTGQRGKVIAR